MTTFRRTDETAPAGDVLSVDDLLAAWDAATVADPARHGHTGWGGACRHGALAPDQLRR
ncbi:MAG: hypothetical protein S0880_20395 [Actinomycetota bacterium]|nr:hypothetical protein [Actinomycetota bacterium]